jgi:hypothetical protein
MQRIIRSNFPGVAGNLAPQIYGAYERAKSQEAKHTPAIYGSLLLQTALD